MIRLNFQSWVHEVEGNSFSMCVWGGGREGNGMRRWVGECENKGFRLKI